MNRNETRRFGLLARAVGLVWQAAKFWTVVSSALLFLQGLLPLVSIFLLKLILDSVGETLRQSGPSRDFKHVYLLVAVAAAVALLSVIVRLTTSVVSEIQTQKVADHIRGLIYQKSVELDLEYYENPKYQDTFHRAQQEAPFRPPRIVNGLLQMAQSGVSLIATAVLLMITLPWAFTLILILACLPGLFLKIRQARRAHDWAHQNAPVERRLAYLSNVITGPWMAKEVRVFSLGPYLISSYLDLKRGLREALIKQAVQRSTGELVGQIGVIGATFGALAWIASQTINGALSYGALGMFYLAFQRAQGFLQEFLASISALYENNLFLGSIFEFMDLKPKVSPPAVFTAFPNALRHGIEIRSVGFQYPDSPRVSLDGISATIRPGQLVALVGENGSGKTTLVKLLCRLYDPTTGSITVDGIDLRQFSPDDLRRQFSVVFQDFGRYSLTVRQNIGLGDVAQMNDRQAIEEAARAADADPFIQKLRHGYETELGKLFEDGEEISIGQWQKIAIARAFLRKSPICIMDEPTSALDARAEDEVFRKFRLISQGRTTILISHRLSTVRTADLILFLEDGRLTEQGTHDELIKVGGGYARLFDLQARHYL